MYVCCKTSFPSAIHCLLLVMPLHYFLFIKKKILKSFEIKFAYGEKIID